MKSIRILMTGAGAPGAPGILKCLKKSGDFEIFVCDANRLAVGKHLNGGNFFIVPKASDPQFTAQILRICQENQIQVVMPLVTRELFELTRVRAEWKSKGVHVLVSDPAALEIANDKINLYEHLKKHDIVVPGFFLASTVREFEKAVSDLGYPAKPVCFKPGISNGSRGFRILNEKMDEAELLFNEKPNSTYMSYTDAKRILAQKPFPRLLVSEFMPGPEYSVDCLAENGKCKIAVPRIRTRMVGGISVEGEFIRNAEMIRYSEQIIESIGLHGNIGIQVKEAVDGTFKILEINPRVQGTICAGLGAGINLPDLAVRQELGMPISAEQMRVQWGTHFVRYWEEVFY